MVVKNLAQSLRRYGIEATEYRNPPAGREVFAITILNRKKHGHDKGVVTLNHGQAKVEVFGSPKRRQAAVTVKEDERKITRLVKVREAAHEAPGEESVIRLLKANFPLTMPFETAWTVENVQIKQGLKLHRSEHERQRWYWHCSGTVTASVENKSTNHFLIGMDETHHFISPLPKQATSVAMAHRFLRGRKVKKGTTRQGEWFFVPVSRKMSARLNKIATDQSGRLGSIRLGKSTHIAKTAIRLSIVYPDSASSKRSFVGSIYARGFITDNRHGHHRSIFLKSWCKVQHNEETEMQISPAQAAASAARRRMRTFD